ncbi:MAG: AtpZ/AtpI family protein [Planctomycetota bacterium]
MAGGSGKFDRDQLQAWSAGLDIPAGAFGLGLVGYLIDRWQGTGPWWMLGLGLLGVAGGCYRFVREALRMNRQQAARFNRDHRGHKSPPPSSTQDSAPNDANNDPNRSPGG